MKSNSIHVLPDNVINKIAAGEVVERPASVVKELVENAIDSGATHVQVEIIAGGKTLVAVGDDGSGMSRGNALLSIERHATSKIGDVDDIEKVTTLGFRGEALAAISSVARFTMRTRQADALAGTELVMAGGKMQDVRDAGCPPGTLVEVRHLFFNVPARRKFMRSDQTEEAHVRHAFMLHALANPPVGMKLKSDGRLLYDLPANASMESRLGDLFVSIKKEDLRAVDFKSETVRVTGYAALPSLTRADRSEQYLFVNRRPVAVPLLAGAIRDGYEALVPKNRYPVIFLFLDMDPALVDVNVHPAKREVRFFNPGEVRSAVSNAIRNALRSSTGSFPPSPGASRQAGQLQPGARPGAGENAFGRMLDYHRLHKVKNDDRTPGKQPLPPDAGAAAGMPPSAGTREAEAGRPWAWRRVVGQIGSLYVVLETEDGLVLMDPHAAHERVLFEEFMAGAARGAVESQALLMAESVVLSPADADCLRQGLPALQKAGFGIAEFGRDTFLVDSVPACFGDVSALALIREIAASLNESSGRGRGIAAIEEQIARSACHAAVKAHARLTTEETEHLLDRLEKAEMPYTCPHGRPIIIHFSFQELAKKFGRSAPRAEDGGNG